MRETICTLHTPLVHEASPHDVTCGGRVLTPLLMLIGVSFTMLLSSSQFSRGGVGEHLRSQEPVIFVGQRLMQRLKPWQRATAPRVLHFPRPVGGPGPPSITLSQALLRGHALGNALADVTDAQNAKLSLVELVRQTEPNGLGATPVQRSEINRLVTLLESNNPTPQPARSAFNNGTWRMVYTDMPPSPSSGKLGPFVGDVFQLLQPEQSRITNMLEVRFPPIRGGLVAKQSIVSDDTWRIVFKSVQNSIAGVSVMNKPFPSESEDGAQVRLWKHTYLDKDLRILRAGREDGDPEEFLFITTRD